MFGPFEYVMFDENLPFNFPQPDTKLVEAQGVEILLILFSFFLADNETSPQDIQDPENV